MSGPTLRERLEAKRRRTLTQYVLVDNPEPLRDAVEAASRALAAALVNGSATTDETPALQAGVERAQAALGDAIVAVDFQALADVEFELLVADHTVPDAEHGAVVNRETLLPHLAAACAMDESLKDADWWAELLARPEWTDAEKSHLYYSLFNTLHYSVPSGVLGKG